MANAINIYGTNDATYAAIKPLITGFQRAHEVLFENLLAIGIGTKHDAKPYVVRFVFEETGVKPHESRKGGAWTFVKDSKPESRVDYLLGLMFPRVDPNTEKLSRKPAPVVKVPKALVAQLREVLGEFDAKQIRAALTLIEAADKAAEKAAKAAEKLGS